MRAKAEQFLRKAWFPYLVIGIISFLVWGPTVRFDFVWDDHLYITQNKSIRSLRNLPEMFYSPDAQASETAPLFRPLRTAHFAILNALAGKPLPQPWIFHLANILWHTAAATLLFSVAGLLTQEQFRGSVAWARVVALLISIAFAVHPVTSEVVCWAKSLDDIMAAVFVLAATRSLLIWQEGKRGFWLALLYYLLAVYSKESAVPFALLVFFIGYGFHKHRLRRSVMLAVPFLFVAVVYIAHRHLVIGQSSQAAPISGTYGQTLIDMFPVATKYVRLFWGLPPFCIDYSYLTGHYRFLSGEVIAGAVILLLFIGITIWAWQHRGFWLASFGFIWMGLFLLPVSNLVPMMQYMAERFLYLPLIGFLLALAAWLLNLSRVGHSPGSAPTIRPFLPTTVVGLLVLIWASLSWNRSGIWRDELTLFARSSLEHPRSHRVEKNALVAIFSLPHMKALFPDYIETHILRVTDSISRAEAEPVIRTLIEAQRIFPESELVSTSLGFAYAKSGQTREAIPLFEMAARQNPEEPQCWINLATVRRDNKDDSKARQACETALRLAPSNIEALRVELEICSDSGDYNTALACARKLREIEPQKQEHQHRIHEIEKKLDSSNPNSSPP